MKQPPEKSFGFEYEHDGKQYAAHLIAPTQADAEARLASMSKSRCIGQLHDTTVATAEQSYLSGI